MNEPRTERIIQDIFFADINCEYLLEWLKIVNGLLKQIAIFQFLPIYLNFLFIPSQPLHL